MTARVIGWVAAGLADGGVRGLLQRARRAARAGEVRRDAGAGAVLGPVAAAPVAEHRGAATTTPRTITTVVASRARFFVMVL